MAFCLLSLTGYSQSDGDFISNGTGDWSDNTKWLEFNAGAYGPTPTAPNSSNGIIQIRAGDSISLTTTLTIDQVVVLSGGILTLFNNIAPVPPGIIVTLNNSGTGDDLIINTGGKFYLAGSSMILSGTGTLRNDAGGLVTLEFSPTLAVNSTNNGEVDISQTVALSNATLTNNKNIVWLDHNVNLTSANVINNDSIITFADPIGPTPTFTAFTGTGTFSNSLNSVFFNSVATNVSGGSPGVIFANAGTLKGVGTFTILSTSGANTGTISPGDNSAAILTVDPAYPSTGNTTYKIALNSGGDVAGTNYGQIDFANTGAASIANATLTVTDAASGDPVGTVYTLFSAATNGINLGGFSALNLPSSLSAPTNNGTTITVTRTVILPITWGNFDASAVNNTVQLSWTTLQESNSSHFFVQHSVDGKLYTDLGSLPARGNSPTPSNYAFTDPAPDLNHTNYYRIEEVDLDGKGSYSVTKAVNFKPGTAVAVRISPNPTTDVLQITVQQNDISIMVTDLSGRTLQVMKLEPGYHETSIRNYAPGIYQLTIYQKQNRIDSQKILKL
jgi:hypothetical protein